jgi:hypothetical protein
VPRVLKNSSFFSSFLIWEQLKEKLFSYSISAIVVARSDSNSDSISVLHIISKSRNFKAQNLPKVLKMI